MNGHSQPALLGGTADNMPQKQLLLEFPGFGGRPEDKFCVVCGEEAPLAHRNNIKGCNRKCFLCKNKSHHYRACPTMAQTVNPWWWRIRGFQGTIPGLQNPPPEIPDLPGPVLLSAPPEIVLRVLRPHLSPTDFASYSGTLQVAKNLTSLSLELLDEAHHLSDEATRLHSASVRVAENGKATLEHLNNVLHSAVLQWTQSHSLCQQLASASSYISSHAYPTVAVPQSPFGRINPTQTQDHGWRPQGISQTSHQHQQRVIEKEPARAKPHEKPLEPPVHPSRAMLIPRGPSSMSPRPAEPSRPEKEPLPAIKLEEGQPVSGLMASKHAPNADTVSSSSNSNIPVRSEQQRRTVANSGKPKKANPAWNVNPNNPNLTPLVVQRPGFPQRPAPNPPHVPNAGTERSPWQPNKRPKLDDAADPSYGRLSPPLGSEDGEVVENNYSPRRRKAPAQVDAQVTGRSAPIVSHRAFIFGDTSHPFGTMQSAEKAMKSVENAMQSRQKGTKPVDKDARNLATSSTKPEVVGLMPRRAPTPIQSAGIPFTDDQHYTAKGGSTVLPVESDGIPKVKVGSDVSPSELDLPQAARAETSVRSVPIPTQAIGPITQESWDELFSEGLDRHLNSTNQAADEAPKNQNTVIVKLPNVADGGPNVADAGSKVADSGSNIADNGLNGSNVAKDATVEAYNTPTLVDDSPSVAEEEEASESDADSLIITGLDGIHSGRDGRFGMPRWEKWENNESIFRWDN